MAVPDSPHEDYLNPSFNRDPTMNRKTLAISAALVCATVSLGAGIAVAQDVKSASPMDRLGKFVGDGVCIGTMTAGENSGSTTTGKFHAEKTLDGHWILIRYEQDRSAANPRPFKVAQYLGYDPAGKRFITVMLGNGDGVYSVGTSPGWNGNTITFEEVEVARGKPGHTREAFTTVGSGLSGYTGWFRDKSGKWIKADEETCKPS